MKKKAAMMFGIILMIIVMFTSCCSIQKDRQNEEARARISEKAEESTAEPVEKTENHMSYTF